jgi:hypothetical protein
MKKILFTLALVTGFFVLFACTSAPPPPDPAPAPAPEQPKAPEPAPAPAPAPVATPAPPPPERASDLILDGAETYTVVRKDTLSYIAKLKYGSNNGFYYPLIMMASRDLVEDQDYIEPGMVLTIPRIQPNLNDARAKASMKKFFLELADITERQCKRPQDAAGLRKLANQW